MTFNNEASKAARETRSEEKADKICKYCIHHIPHTSPNLGAYAICARPSLKERVDPVSGDVMGHLCAVQRTFSSPDSCGPEGRFFEGRNQIGELPSTALDQKTFDWWDTRQCWSRFMFQDAVERGHNADKADKAKTIYMAARADYQLKYEEEFDPIQRPIDVSEVCPTTVDKRIDI